MLGTAGKGLIAQREDYPNVASADEPALDDKAPIAAEPSQSIEAAESGHHLSDQDEPLEPRVIAMPPDRAGADMAADQHCLMMEAAPITLTEPYYSGLDAKEFAAAMPEASDPLLPVEIGAVVDEAADAVGLNRSFMRAVAYLESSGDPGNITGSYKGLFQLSLSEFHKYGGGKIFHARDNAMAAAFKLNDEIVHFREQYGRDPTATEIYLVHQQGMAGLTNHLANPDAPAWQNMAATAEGRRKGARWARAAIWGNVPQEVKQQLGSVDAVTSSQFVDIWRRRVEKYSRSEPQFNAQDGMSTASSVVGSCLMPRTPASLPPF